MSRQIKDILSWILYMVVIIALTVLFLRFVMQRTQVLGNSMRPTLEDGDSLMVDKLSYRFTDPERFDIVVFPLRHGEETYIIKRVIGLPGETVQITEDGRILVNGEVLTEHYGLEVIKNPGRAAEPLTLGSDEYFLLGDNRNNSLDSREATIGNVKRSELIGKAFIRVYPFSSFGILKHQ